MTGIRGLAVAASLVCAGCIQIPLPIFGGGGALPQGLRPERPMLFLGSTHQTVDATRRYVLDEVEHRMWLRLPVDLPPLVPERTSLGVRRALERVQRGGERAYSDESGYLPPHYVVRYRVALDGSDLPSHLDVVEAARGHAIWRLALSWLPVHAVTIGVRCEVELFEAEGDRQTPLISAVHDDARRHLGNYWWLTSTWETTVRESYGGLVDDCLRVVRDFPLTWITAQPSGNPPGVNAP